jgi:ribosomal protein S3AE
MADNNRNAAKNAAKAAAEAKKQKKKKWCPIVAPAMFNNKVIGESLLDDASMLMNRHVTANMMQLNGDMKRQNVSIMFKVVDVQEGKALTEAVKYEISSSSLRRLAKREKDKLSDSFVVKTADEKLVRIKPLMITNNLTKGSVSAALIKDCRAACKELVNKIKFEQLLGDLVMNKFQREVKEILHKTYPLRTFEVRMLSIETRKKKESIEEEELLKIKQAKELKKKEKMEESEIEERANNEEDANESVDESADDEPVDDSPEESGDDSEENSDDDSDDSEDNADDSEEETEKNSE